MIALDYYVLQEWIMMMKRGKRMDVLFKKRQVMQCLEARHPAVLSEVV